MADHSDGFDRVFEAFETAGGPITELAGIGHRVVHGGDRFTAPTLVDDAVIAGHRATWSRWPRCTTRPTCPASGSPWPASPRPRRWPSSTPRSTRPCRRRAYRYAIDRPTWPASCASAATASTAPPTRTSPARPPSCWAARPTSSTWSPCTWATAPAPAAVRGGRCVDTSMGLTPLEGLVMGTRCGDLDPAVVFHLHREAGMSVDDIDDLLNKRSGTARAVPGPTTCARSPAWSPTATRRPPRPSTSTATGSASTSGPTRRSSAGWTRSCSPPGSGRTTTPSGPASAGPGGPRRQPRRQAQQGPLQGPPDDLGRRRPVAVLVVPTNEELEIAEQTLAVVGG